MNEFPAPLKIIDNERFYCRVYGEGPPVMLIHGNRGSGDSFAPMIPLMKGYQLIAPDLPGHGNASPMPNGFMDNPEMAVDYCFGITDSLGVENFTIIGHSLGGMIGLLMHLMFRERISGIVLLDSFVTMSERPKELLRVAPYPYTDERTSLQIMDCLNKGPGVNWYKTFDVSGRIKDITCPVFELQGESTPDTQEIFDEWLKEKRNGFPKAWEVVRILNSAHFLQFEQTKEITDKILPWLCLTCAG